MGETDQLPQFEIASVTGGQLIKIARRLRGFSQKDLCQLIGMAIRTLRNYEQGVTEPSYITVASILDCMGISYEDCWKNVI